jgi:hypothetical protein
VPLATPDDVSKFTRAVKYQAAILALQLFLQNHIAQEDTLAYNTFIQFYIKKCPTVVDFLTCRTLLFWHEDDERDGSENETPITNARVQEVFENIEEFVRARVQPENLCNEMVATLDAKLVLLSPEFNEAVDTAFAKIKAAYDYEVVNVMQQMFSDCSFPPDWGQDYVMQESAIVIVSASVMSTESFYKVYSDEELDDLSNKFYFLLNEECDITQVHFETIEIDLNSPEKSYVFAERIIASKTYFDSRLHGFYDYATKCIIDALNIKNQKKTN